MFSRNSQFSSLEQSMASLSSAAMHRRQIWYKLVFNILLAVLFRIWMMLTDRNLSFNWPIFDLIWFYLVYQLPPNRSTPIWFESPVNRFCCSSQIHSRRSTVHNRHIYAAWRFAAEKKVKRIEIHQLKYTIFIWNNNNKNNKNSFLFKYIFSLNVTLPNAILSTVEHVIMRCLGVVYVITVGALRPVNFRSWDISNAIWISGSNIWLAWPNTLSFSYESM